MQEVPHGSSSWAALDNMRQNRAFLGREVGAPLLFWGFWPEKGWEDALGSTVWGGCEHIEHHGCYLSSAGISAFPELGDHLRKEAGPEVRTCVPQFSMAVLGPKFCIHSHPHC